MWLVLLVAFRLHLLLFGSEAMNTSGEAARGIVEELR